MPKIHPLAGSLQPDWKTCGKLTCRCARGQLHGPYWSHRWRDRGNQRRRYVPRIGEQLLPLLDRCNRMLLRNLKALQSLRKPAIPSVSIGAAGQVNVAGGPQANMQVPSAAALWNGGNGSGSP